MSRYLASRLVEIVVTLALMSFVVYLLIGLMPGDPIDLMIAGDPKMTSEDAARLRAVYGVDKPLLERYLAWAQQALMGNFGYSRSFNQPVPGRGSAMPPAGRTPSFTANSVISSSASQNGGVEMPAKENRFTR